MDNDITRYENLLIYTIVPVSGERGGNPSVCFYEGKKYYLYTIKYSEIPDEEFNELVEQNGLYAVYPPPPEQVRIDICKTLLWQGECGLWDNADPQVDESSFHESYLQKPGMGKALFFNQIW